MELTSDAAKCFPERNLMSWEVLISKYVQNGQGEAALDCYEKLLAKGVQPDRITHSWILKACGSIGAISYGMKVHTGIIKDGSHACANVGSSLVHMYAKCGCLKEACKVFNNIANQNIVTWGVMMTGYIQHGFGLEALEFYKSMLQHGLKPDRVIFLCLLQACSGLEAIEQGKLLHDAIIRAGLELDLAIGSTLLDMYAKCASLNEAQEVFNKMPIRNMVPWNALMSGYTQHGSGSTTLSLFKRMQQEGIWPTKATFLCIIKACGSIRAIKLGKQIHNLLLTSKICINVAIGNSLIDMYAKCENLEQARRVFDELATRDDVSWGAMIAGYVQNGHCLLALELSAEMQRHGLKPDKVIFSIMLKACSSVQALERGKMIHDQVKKNGLEYDVIIGNTLIDMYAKCGHLTDAREVFDNLPNRTEVSWGTMIAGYTQHGLGLSALEIFNRMQQEGITPGNVILTCVVKACGSIGALDCGYQVHNQYIQSEVRFDVIVGNALVDMYIRCEQLEDAHSVFDELSARDVVSWSTMVAGYVQDGQGIPALHLFARSQEEGITPDRVLILCVLKACSNVGTLEMGRLVHDKVIRRGLESDTAIGNTLLDMYTKCRSLEEAKMVFRNLRNRNVVSWNAMIAGFAQHGYCELALQCFGDMVRQNIEPDSWTFSSILSACSEAALVKEGYRYFKLMEKDHGIAPSVEHFNCIIDLLGRAGRVKEAIKLLQTMPVLPDITTWVSLLTASRMYGYVDLAIKCFNEVARLEPDTAAVYALLSHMYADFDLRQDAWKIQELKKCCSAWKKPGKACIETGHIVQEFTVGEKIGLHSHGMDQKSQLLGRLLKEQGYTPKLELIFESPENDSSSSNSAFTL